MATLADKYRGCLLGGAVGDMIGAAVEAESPEYIASAFTSIEDILSTGEIAEFAGRPWQVGRFTDDTLMMLDVTEWLIDDESHSPERLLERFAETYEPSRRYGSGTEVIFRLFADHATEWRQLSTAMFPWGSYGNGSAMRVAPIGLAYFRDVDRAATAAEYLEERTGRHGPARGLLANPKSPREQKCVIKLNDQRQTSQRQ